MRYILGIDQSGKTNLIGNLFVVGVVAEARVVAEMGSDVKDSKTYTSSSKINETAQNYKDKVEVLTRVYTPSIVDSYVFGLNKSLNTLLFDAMCDICVEAVDKFEVDEIYIDSPTASCQKWRDAMLSRILSKVNNPFCRFNLICENKAETKYKIVAIASIFARVSWVDHMLELSNKIYTQTGIRIKNGVSTQESSLLYCRKFPQSKNYRKSWKI